MTSESKKLIFTFHKLEVYCRISFGCKVFYMNMFLVFAPIRVKCLFNLTETDWRYSRAHPSYYKSIAFNINRLNSL